MTSFGIVIDVSFNGHMALTVMIPRFEPDQNLSGDSARKKDIPFCSKDSILFRVRDR